MATLIKIKHAENMANLKESKDATNTTSSEALVINKELLVNINCNIGLVADYIRESIGLKSTDFDLWEESTSELKNMSSWKCWTSALDVLKPNDTYICVVEEQNPDSQSVNHVPLIGGKIPKALADVITNRKKLSKKQSLSTATPLREKGGRKKMSGK